MQKILLFLAFIPIVAFSQKPKKVNIKKYSVGFTFSPDFSYRKLNTDIPTPTTTDLIKERNQTEHPKLGYTSGFNFSIYFNRRFTLEMGLLYADKGHIKSIDGGYSPTNPTSPLSVDFNYHYLYLDIPIKANYYIIPKKRLYLIAGLSPNFFIAQKTTSISHYNDGHTSRHTGNLFPTGFNKVNLAFILGIGQTYKLKKNTYIKIEPTYRRYLAPIKDASINEYLYSAGLNAGVYYKF